MAKALSRTPIDRLGCIFGVTALLFMALVLSSCNTVEGMGEDVSAAGGAVRPDAGLLASENRLPGRYLSERSTALHGRVARLAMISNSPQRLRFS